MTSYLVDSPGWNGRVVGLDGTPEGFIAAYEERFGVRLRPPAVCVCGLYAGKVFHSQPWCGSTVCGLKIQQQLGKEKAY